MRPKRTKYKYFRRATVPNTEIKSGTPTSPNKGAIATKVNYNSGTTASAAAGVIGGMRKRAPAELKEGTVCKGRATQVGKEDGEQIRIAAGSNMNFGTFGLKALQSGIITDSQIESLIKIIKKKLKKQGKLWLRVFPNIPVSKKPSEVRMGKGKGSIDHFVCRVKKDRILLELNCKHKALANSILKSAAIRLPLKTSRLRN